MPQKNPNPDYIKHPKAWEIFLRSMRMRTTENSLPIRIYYAPSESSLSQALRTQLEQDLKDLKLAVSVEIIGQNNTEESSTDDIVAVKDFQALIIITNDSLTTENTAITEIIKAAKKTVLLYPTKMPTNTTKQNTRHHDFSQPKQYPTQFSDLLLSLYDITENAQVYQTACEAYQLAQLDNAPADTPFFTKNQKIATLVKKAAVATDQTDRPIILCGPMGSGKASLAKAIVSQICFDSDQKGEQVVCRWIDARPELIERQLRAFAKALKISSASTRPIRELTLEIYQIIAHKNILLVFHNAGSPTQFIDYLPSTSHPFIIITSTHPLWATQGISMEGLPLESTSAYLSLQKITASSEETKLLTSRFSTTPLALSLATAYLKKNSMTVTEYAKECSEETEYLAIVQAVINMSLKKITPVALRFLKYASWLAAEEIPLTLAKQFLEEIVFEKTIAELKAYRFIQTGSSEYYIRLHPLLQKIIRQFNTDLTSAIEDLKEVCNQLTLSYQKIEGDQTEQEALLPHIMRVKTHVKTHLETALPSTQKMLQMQFILINKLLANLYGDLNEHAKKITALETVLEAQQLTCNPSNHQLYSTLFNLGNAYGLLKQYPMQQYYLAQARTIQIHFIEQQTEKTADAEAELELARINICLAIAYSQLGPKYRLSERKQLLQAALVTRQCYYQNTEEKYKIAKTLIHLAQVCALLGQFEEQATYLEDALAIQKQVYGENSKDAGMTFMALGNIAKKNHNIEDAESYYQSAAAAFTQVAGKSHPLTQQANSRRSAMHSLVRSSSIFQWHSSVHPLPVGPNANPTDSSDDSSIEGYVTVVSKKTSAPSRKTPPRGEQRPLQGDKQERKQEENGPPCCTIS